MMGIFQRKGGWVAAIIFAVIGFVLVNALASRVTGVRLDLTQDRLYTLSEGSENILGSLSVPVTIDLYYSRELGNEIPQYATFAARVQDMLREFEAASRGQLTVNLLNPEPFSEIEDAAVENGLQGVPLDDSGDVVYFGLTVQADGSEDIASVPFFQTDRETFLEYDLTKLVWQVTNPEQPVVGVISSKPVFGNPLAAMRGDAPDPWFALVQAQDFFDLRYVTSAETLVEANPDILLIIHPGEMDEMFLYSIDQFLLRGGRAMVFLDPWNETFVAASTAAAGITGGMTERSDLASLLDRWGVSLLDNAVIGDREMARVVNAGRGTEVIATPYSPWVEVKPGAMNLEDAIMAPIQELLMPSPGALEIAEGSGLTLTPLITTTDQAMAIDPEELRVPDPMRLNENYAPGGIGQVLAARLSGEVESNFADGAPQPVLEPGKAPPEPIAFGPHLARSEAPMNMIVVTDADMLEDPYWTNIQNFFGQRVAVPVLDNGTFLVNALENLNGSSDLLSLRARRTGQRSFEVIDALRFEAEEQFRAQQQSLTRQLDEVQAELAGLQSPNGGGVEDPDAAMERITKELLETRRNLREVNRNLRQDIEDLETNLRFLNIGLIPILVTLFAIGLGIYRTRQRNAAAR